MLEFDASGWGVELPIGLGVIGISVAGPSGDFVDEGLFVRDAALEALGRQDTQLGFGQIKPASMFWSVAPFEALDQSSCFGGRKGFVE